MEGQELSLEWARQQFGPVALGDWRLRQRLIDVAGAIRWRPSGVPPHAFLDRAGLKGAYRFLNNHRVTYEGLLEPHFTQTRKTCSEPGEYLLIEDTTALSYTHRRSCSIPGLGQITDQQDSQGLMMHSCLATRIVNWTPSGTPEVELLGLLGQQCWSRAEAWPKRTHTGKTRGGESDKWGHSVFEGDVPHEASWTRVGDREADIYTLMHECQAQNLGFVLRAAHPRRVLTPSSNVMDAAQQSRPLGCVDLPVRARPGVKARTARVTVRACPVTLKPPYDLRDTLQPLSINLVYAAEEEPSAAPPLCWILLTTKPCQTFSQACQTLRIYATRWLIEEYHKVLKSGTHLEDSQLGTAEGLRNLAAIHALVAMDILKLKFLAQFRADEPVTEDLVPHLWLRLLEARLGTQSAPWTYRTTLIAIARLGGFLARPRDGLPGWQTIWRGWQLLQWMALGYEIALN